LRTRSERARKLDQRQSGWLTSAGQPSGESILYFINLATALGFDISIQEFWLSLANVLRSGQRLIPHGEEFIWFVKLKLENSWIFRAGRNVAGDRLGGFEISDAECILRRLKPAHTILVF